ncbi:hypothetical protein Tco_0378493, partial [Tanacetum coccineum]
GLDLRSALEVCSRVVMACPSLSVVLSVRGSFLNPKVSFLTRADVVFVCSGFNASWLLMFLLIIYRYPCAEDTWLLESKTPDEGRVEYEVLQVLRNKPEEWKVPDLLLEGCVVGVEFSRKWGYLPIMGDVYMERDMLHLSPAPYYMPRPYADGEKRSYLRCIKREDSGVDS